MASLLNQTRTRSVILLLVQKLRPGWRCTRVSPKYLQALESHLLNKIKADVHSHPSVGKTFNP